MSKSNEYGYIPESPTQARGSNTGIFEVNDVTDLLAAKQWSGDFGKLELIETKTASADSFIDFTSLGSYNVHFITGNDINMSANNQFFRARLSNDGGSSFITSATQERAGMRMLTTGSFGDTRSTTDTFFGHYLTDNSGGYGTTADNGNFYLYCYNLLDSSKYSFCTSHSTGLEQSSSTYSAMFGSGTLPTAETHNAIRFLNSSTGTFSGTLSLYGIAES